MTVDIQNDNGLRSGSYDILGIKGTLPTQAITQVNLEQAIEADQPNLDFGTKVLGIIEMEPNRLSDDKAYQKERIKDIKKMIKGNSDKLCFLSIRGIKDNFRIDRNLNEFLIQFQIKCGFKLIMVFFRYVKDVSSDLQHFRNTVESKKKTFVACIDENLDSEIFESLYLECIKSKDDIISFFGRKENLKNIGNFHFILSRRNDNVMRLTSFISKRNKGMTNSVAQNLLGFDCYSFAQRPSINTRYGRLDALDGFYFNPLEKDTTLVCVLTGENLYEASQKFKKNQGDAYLPIHIHNMVRLNQLLRKLHVSHTREELLALFGNRIL